MSEIWTEYFCKKCGFKTKAEYRSAREQAQLCVRCYLEEKHKGEK